MILRTTCCDMNSPLGRGIIQPAVYLQQQQNACNAYPNANHVIRLHDRLLYLRLPTRLLPVNGFRAPLPLDLGKVIEFLGLRARWFLVFWSFWLRWGFLVEVFASTSISESKVCLSAFVRVQVHVEGGSGSKANWRFPVGVKPTMSELRPR